MHVDRSSVLGEHSDSRCHVPSVKGAGHLQRAQSRLLGRVGGEGRKLLEGAGHDDLPGTVLVGGGEPVGLGLGDDVVALAAEDCRHARGGDGGGGGHGVSALAHEDHRLLGGEDSGAHRRGDLADAVAGSGRHLGVGLGGVREQAQQAHQTCAHQQRLRDRGVTDRLGVALGAVREQIDAGDRREPSKSVGEPLDLQPWEEETGGLGALSGRDNGEHGSSVSIS